LACSTLDNKQKVMFSRLEALSKLGVVDNYSEIHSKSITVIGIGGIGAVAAEMLVRLGVGRLFLFDYDTVEIENMNRMVYTPIQIGMPKVDAAVATLKCISSDKVELNGTNCNVTSISGYNKMRESISQSDLVLCCVDNYSARIAVNRCCLELNKVWFESGVSETAMSGHVQFMEPGTSACFECAPPLVVAENGDESKIRRDIVCTASLPTTMSIVAGIMVQSSLKVLLNFGVISNCVGYHALTDFFPVMDIKPNPDCVNATCRQLQGSTEPRKKPSVPVVENVEAIHETNDWGIQVVENDESVNANSGLNATLPGLDNLSVGDLVSRLRNR
jgi:ubiquitin-like modifier-activating enzyme 5